jgi:hypothetical protein
MTTTRQTIESEIASAVNSSIAAGAAGMFREARQERARAETLQAKLDAMPPDTQPLTDSEIRDVGLMTTETFDAGLLVRASRQLTRDSEMLRDLAAQPESWYPMTREAVRRREEAGR